MNRRPQQVQRSITTQEVIQRYVPSNKNCIRRFSDLTAQSDEIYLHVGPSGDCWTGKSIFAAKHLQPDYVKSIKLDRDIQVEVLLELLEEDTDLAMQIYDNEILPDSLTKKAKKGTEIFEKIKESISHRSAKDQ